jgi:hypothetical protein
MERTIKEPRALQRPGIVEEILESNNITTLPAEATTTNLEWSFEPTLDEFKADLVNYLRPYVRERFEEI